jgi:hypothetical protein
MIKSCEIDLTQHCKGPRLALDEDLIVALGCWLRESVIVVTSSLPHATPQYWWYQISSSSLLHEYCRASHLSNSTVTKANLLS